MIYQNNIIDKEKIKLIDYQIIATIIFIMSTIFSIFLLYNKKLIILNKEPILQGKESKIADNVNSTIVLIIVLFLQYLNYKSKNISELENEDIAPINLDITATYLLIIASIISLYSAYISPEEGTESISLV